MKARHKDTGEIIELAEEGIISRDGRRFCWYQVELITEPIDECKPSLPSDLDEAANNYGVDIRLGYPRVMDETDKYIYNAFKAGAEWMAVQGETHDSEIVSRVTGNGLLPAITCLVDPSYKEGDKVIIQVRKK